jgi:tripartite-type tricarboxylate transporter receptor subunit TctC
MPNLPTAAKAGLPGFQIEFSWSLIGRARTPTAAVKRLNEELNAVLAAALAGTAVLALVVRGLGRLACAGAHLDQG